MTTLYRLFDAENGLLYVGVSCHGIRRFDEHQAKHWWPTVAVITVEHFADRKSALDAEAAALRTEAPLHNRQGVPGRTCGMRTRNGFPCRHVTDGDPCFDHGGPNRTYAQAQREGKRLAELLKPVRVSGGAA